MDRETPEIHLCLLVLYQALARRGGDRRRACASFAIRGIVYGSTGSGPEPAGSPTRPCYIHLCRTTGLRSRRARGRGRLTHRRFVGRRSWRGRRGDLTCLWGCVPLLYFGPAPVCIVSSKSGTSAVCLSTDVSSIWSIQRMPRATLECSLGVSSRYFVCALHVSLLSALQPSARSKLVFYLFFGSLSPGAVRVPELLKGAGVDAVEAVVEVQAAGGATGEPGSGSELFVAAQGGLQGREVSPPSQPACCLSLQPALTCWAGLFFARGRDCLPRWWKPDVLSFTAFFCGTCVQESP